MTNLPFHTMIHNGSQAPAPMGHRQEPEVGRNMSFQRGYKFHRRNITNTISWFFCWLDYYLHGVLCSTQWYFHNMLQMLSEKQERTSGKPMAIITPVEVAGKGWA